MKTSILYSTILFLLSFSGHTVVAESSWSWKAFASSSDATTLHAPPPVCNMPGGQSTSSISETSATFNWNDVAGAVSYSVQFRQPWDSWNYVPGSPFYNNLVTIYGLQPNTTYEWRVRANCSGGEYSAWTTGVRFITEGSYSNCEPPS